VSANYRAGREKGDLNLFEQSWFDLGHNQGDREVMQNGRRESQKEGRIRGRWTDMQTERHTTHTKGCLGGIWWTDVCVFELMEESYSLRAPKLAFAHKEGNSR